jgi:hypothetical protein
MLPAVVRSVVSLALVSGLFAQEAERDLDELVRRVRGGDAEALEALGKRGAPAVSRLASILADTSLEQRLRYVAANHLGATRAPEAYEPLIRALADPVFNVRRCAAYGLSLLGDRRALPALEKLAQGDPFSWRDQQTGDQRWLVREAANEAIKKLGGKPVRLPDPPAAFVPPPILTGSPFVEALPWAASVEDALAAAKEEKRLVFATVVPVDSEHWVSGFRAAETMRKGLSPPPLGVARAMAADPGLAKERVMMATLLSDPALSDWVRRRTVPVRIRVHTLPCDPATRRAGDDPLTSLGLTTLACPPPAVVIATADGKLLHHVAGMTVFSAGVLPVPLLEALLPGDAGRGPRATKPSLVLERARERVRAGDLGGARKLLEPLVRDARAPHRLEASLALACIHARAGDDEAARTLLERLRVEDPDGSHGGVAALMLARDGVRLGAWQGDPLVPPAVLPIRTESRRSLSELESVVQDAVRFLLDAQAADGSFEDPFRFPGTAPGLDQPHDSSVPRTALAVAALLDWRDTAGLKERIADAVERGIGYVGRFADAPPPQRIWQQTYALHLQLAILRSKPTEEFAETARTRARKLVIALGRDQVDGGWSYMPAPRIHSFNTAPVLLLLAEAASLGITVPGGMAEKAAAFLEACRDTERPDTFKYASNIDHRHRGASSCRTALCELALGLHRGKVDVPRMQAALDLFLAEEGRVRATRGIFESYFSPTAIHDAYHYLFGHYYAARGLSGIPREAARRHANRQAALLLEQVGLDGSFTDAHMQGKSYGTAMALLTFAALKPHLRDR